MSSPPIGSPGGDLDESHRARTFKIVTTKRTLLLCAPTEEDEIKWLGAVRALIARRSSTAPVDSLSKPATSSHSADPTPHSVPASGNIGLKGKIRRPSLSSGFSSAIIAEETPQ